MSHKTDIEWQRILLDVKVRCHWTYMRFVNLDTLDALAVISLEAQT